MPTKREREYYAMGYRDGVTATQQRTVGGYIDLPREEPYYPHEVKGRGFPTTGSRKLDTYKKKRKLSAWNKYVKANSKKPRFRYRNGKLNLKKMAVAFRKTPAGKKRR